MPVIDASHCIPSSAAWMVLYYGLLALETANNTIAAASSTTAVPGLALSDRAGASRKQRYLSNSIGRMPSSSLSSSNSWIYTEDLRKRFEERYADCRYVFVPVYIDPKSARRHQSSTAIASHKADRDNSWMYSRSLRERLFYSSSKISLPCAANISSSACCVTNHGFMRDEVPAKKNFKARLFKRSASAKEKSTAHVSLSSLPFRSLTASTSSFPIVGNHLGKHRANMVVQEEDDETADDENHSTPLIKHEYVSPRGRARQSVLAVRLGTGSPRVLTSSCTRENSALLSAHLR